MCVCVCGVCVFRQKHFIQPPPPSSQSGVAAATTGVLAPSRRDLPAITSAGLILFLSQALYVHGIDRAGVAVAAALQPAIPVWTAALSVTLGKEAVSRRKVLGIALAAGGALCMVSGPSHAATHTAHATSAAATAAAAASATSQLIGKAALFLNTLSMSAYYIVSKALVARYPPLCVAGWAYIPAAAAMGVAATLTVPAAAWPLAPSLRGPLTYWVLVCSVFGYGATAWAARALPASYVAAFTCLQPFLGTALAACYLGEPVTIWDAGALAVVAGLGLVASEGGAGGGGKRARRAPRPATPLAPPPGWCDKQWRAA